MNFGIRYMMAHGTCPVNRKSTVSERSTERADDTLVFAGGEFYRVATAAASPRGDHLACPIVTRDLRLDGGPDLSLDWAAVGVKRVVRVEEGRRVRLPASQVECQAAIIGDIILTVHDEWMAAR